MSENEILNEVKDAIIEMEMDKAKSSCEQALSQGINPFTIIEQGIVKGITIVGEKFEAEEYYLAELIMAGEIIKEAMKILLPHMKGEDNLKTLGKIVIGTGKGDVHNLGKNIVAMVLKAGGFDVHDLGVDVSPMAFVEAAQENRADIIALSSMMTTTMPGQREVIEILKEMGLRDRYCVIVGGGPVNQQWADQIGADGYGETAPDAVLLARDLLAERKK
ncbi:MAG: B12-binding domain-containing protein [Candidatus Hermodarchaeota archaeon]